MHSNSLTESFLVVPLVALFLVLALLGAVLVLVFRRRNQDTTHRRNVATVDTFLPPIIGGRVPKEMTYMVPRDWRPTTPNAVYTPLSIPLVQPERERSLAARVGSIIHVLPPKSNQSFV